MPKVPTFTKTVPPRVWAVVLARAGSQRLPNKAMLPLCERPMASWYFDALQETDGIERRFLFSDDDALLALAKSSHPKIEVPPFQRPPAVSDASTSSFDSLAYFLQEWQAQSLDDLPDWVMLCQCTSPLVQTVDFQNALQALEAQSENVRSTGLLSVCPPSKPLSWLLKKWQNNVKPANLHLQDDAENTYVTPNGAFYIVPTLALLQKPVGFSLWDLDTVVAYEMPWQRSIDIDTAPDFQVAEALLEAQLKIKNTLLVESTLEKTILSPKPLAPRKRLNPLSRLKQQQDRSQDS
jgi:CMP-N-acetylneuraminic acid synthetase